MPRAERLAPALLGVLGAVEVLLGLWMVVSPHSFFDAIGPFQAYNPHYIRDVSTFSLAIGVASLVAVRRPTWWAPVLTVAAIQFGFHTVNHIVDAGKASNDAIGIIDAVALGIVAVLLGWTAAQLVARPE